MRALPEFLWRITLLSLLLSLPVQAHNGAVAIAVPVEGITVDGDLSDWPEGMRKYSIQNQVMSGRSFNETAIVGEVRRGMGESGSK